MTKKPNNQNPNPKSKSIYLDLMLGAWILVIMSSSAFAYVDPGTGMSFISGLGAMLMGFLALVLGTVIMTFKKWIAWLKSWRTTKREKPKP